MKKKYLEAHIGAGHWEDAYLNGVEDNLGLISCRDGDYWKPIIELETGKIVNWNIGDTAKIHYKSTDDNSFYLLDENKTQIAKYNGFYVIDSMCPESDGYGDYVIMSIDKDGYIENWKDLTDDNDWSFGNDKRRTNK